MNILQGTRTLKKYTVTTLQAMSTQKKYPINILQAMSTLKRYTVITLQATRTLKGYAVDILQAISPLKLQPVEGGIVPYTLAGTEFAGSSPDSMWREKGGSKNLCTKIICRKIPPPFRTFVCVVCMNR